MAKVTSKEVENWKRAGIYEIEDGLRFVFKPSGTKSWILRYQLNGVRRDIGLGGYPKTTLAAARSKADICRGLISKGIDPLEEKNKHKQYKRDEKSNAITFKECALSYIEDHRSGWKNAKHAQQWVNTLTTYAFPMIGKKPVKDITTEDVLKILKPIWKDKTETASRVRSRIELVLDAAKAKQLRTGENPALWRGHLDKLLAKPSKVTRVRNHPAMPYAELPAFMAALMKEDSYGALALQLTILTALRSNEVLNAKWNEIDLENKVWIIPAQRMKMNQEHRVPLTDATINILKKLPTDGLYVFQGMREGKPLSGMSMLMVLRRMNMHQYVVHGFRSTFRDWAAETTNFPREVCEQALAHSLSNKTEAAYMRSDLFEKRRKLMGQWAVFVTSPKSGNVVDIGKQSKAKQ